MRSLKYAYMIYLFSIKPPPPLFLQFFSLTLQLITAASLTVWQDAIS